MRRLAFLLVAACSSPSPSQGLDAPGTGFGCSLRDVNPYGVCYPTADLEVAAGQVIPNTCFATAGFSFCLASLYDPQQRFSARLVHITVASKVVGPSLQELDFIAGTNSSGGNTNGVSWAAELAPDVVFIDDIIDGPTSASTTSIDLQAWLSANGDALTVSGDPLADFLDEAAIPVNIDIDPRTMRILDVSSGFDTNLDQTLKKLVSTL